MIFYTKGGQRQASGADTRTKVIVIKENIHKYSISAMCRVLKSNRSTYYYEAKMKPKESELTKQISEIFRASLSNYGTRKIKQMLSRQGKQISSRRIGRIMRQEGLVSHYTKSQFKRHHNSVNESNVPNLVKRQFNQQIYRQVVVSDLTYVKVGSSWNYICILIDLFNREIIGYSAGRHKTPSLVKQAFSRVKGSLCDIQIFHTDRGSEFKNEAMEQILKAFEISRSLSQKGCPYDNAVAEATFKILKTEWILKEQFSNLEELEMKLWDYVNWYNCHRLHSSLGYLTPVEFRKKHLQEVV